MVETERAPERSRRRRRALLILLLTVSTVSMIGAGTMSLALFTDTDASSGSFTAGTIDVATSPAVLFDVDPMMPGDSDSATLTVDNDGTGDLRYAMTSAATDPDGKGVRSQLTLTIEAGACGSTTGTIYDGAFDGAAFGDPAPGDDTDDRFLAASGSEDLCFTVALPLATGDAYQGATTTATFTFDAEQTANNP